MPISYAPDEVDYTTELTRCQAREYADLLLVAADFLDGFKRSKP